MRRIDGVIEEETRRLNRLIGQAVDMATLDAEEGQLDSHRLHSISDRHSPY
jgi:hypothetical protein